MCRVFNTEFIEQLLDDKLCHISGQIHHGSNCKVHCHSNCLFRQWHVKNALGF